MKTGLETVRTDFKAFVKPLLVYCQIDAMLSICGNLIGRMEPVLSLTAKEEEEEKISDLGLLHK